MPNTTPSEDTQLILERLDQTESTLKREIQKTSELLQSLLRTQEITLVTSITTLTTRLEMLSANQSEFSINTKTRLKEISTKLDLILEKIKTN